ncbi:Chaperone protein ClpB [Fundidesulfovibrio magnetotacticus]|uniref:Chaperone protein ClpB n=1 Tax=Fundidesulfovibrio magnetotacticus TaxID=2730080 RepID=A0A6V8LVE7_9BACT|nr:type VI secretion system ATPase TssH [Fundidesulfovibrio magnetotacticus]GFK94920.1 Chaperone protein ClpB [Fundidesulfovibrio magnetotacticus]
MINVNMKSLLSKLNAFCTSTLHNAAGLTVSRAQYEVTVEHFLLKCLEDAGSDIPVILRAGGVDAGRLAAGLTDSLEDLKTGNAGKPTFSPLLIELIEDAWVVGSVDLGDSRVRSGALLLAFLARPNFYGSGPYLDLLSALNREALLKDFWNATKASSEAAQATAGPMAPGGAPGAAPSGEGSFIARFCQDFTAKAKAGGIDPVFGRDGEIRQIVDILARRRKNNPILVGDPGVGKTAVIEGLALRIALGDVPESLLNVTLINLDMGLLEAGAGMKGEFENRLRGVISEVKASEKPIIMFIDEAHTLVGAGGQAGGSDAANLLKPALARGELKTCAATTWSEYKKYFEKDPALARRFQMVKLDEPSVESATLILRGLRDSYEKSHNVVIRDDAIKICAEYADRYIAARFLPDKAIDLLDTSCARVKVNLTAKPAVLEDAERSIQALEREKNAIERDKDNRIPVDEERLAQVAALIEENTKKAADLTAAWEKEREAAHKVLEIRAKVHETQGDDKAALEKELDEADAALKALQGDAPMIQIEVNPDLVAQVVSDWTGIPMGKVARDQAATIANLEDRIKKRIKGQDMALDVVTQVIKAAKSGIKNPDQPLGVFLLVGPSGTGKTETALTLADILFGSERNVVSINMSEFQEKHTVSRLIGSPPGYVGYGEGGMLTEAVRQHPYSVVLLDETEKAHPDVLNLFYQVFDKGMLSDGEGKEINFKNTLVILTSNLATDVIQEMTKDGAQVPYDAVLSAVRPILSQYFKPALLARMSVAPYVSLSPDAMKDIVVLKLDKLAKMLLDNNKMKMTYTPKVVEAVVARCTEVETGARNIEYILNGNILPRMSQEILGHMTSGGLPASVALDVGEDGGFTMDFA